MGVAVAVAAITGGLAGVQPALAQDSDRLAVDLGECVDLQSPEERFECYENRVEAARREPSDAAPPPEPQSRSEARPRAPAAPAPQGDRPSAGSARAQSAPRQDAAPAPRNAQRSDSDEAREDAEERTELIGTIAALRETVPNSYLITLENGQVWRQMRPRSFYNLQVGHRVRIYPTGWGKSYRLTVDELNGFIQVERIR